MGSAGGQVGVVRRWERHIDLLDAEFNPVSATLNAETGWLEWTPSYTQHGSLQVPLTLTATWTLASGEEVRSTATQNLALTILNANGTPEFIALQNGNGQNVEGQSGSWNVLEGQALRISVFAADPDNPDFAPRTRLLSGALLGDGVLGDGVLGLPRFASVTQQTVIDSNGKTRIDGVIHFAPGEGDRGDYTLSVMAADDGNSNRNQIQIGSQSFVLTVRSQSEAPVITAATQVVAVAGQLLSVPIQVRDLDQDALTFSSEGLPIGAEIIIDDQYGVACLRWTPTIDDIGARDIAIIVSDSGLPPANSGYATPADPQPNSSRHSVRVIVREANAAPQLLGAVFNGNTINGDTLDAASDTVLTIQEGQPFTLDLFGGDSDSDRLNWSAVSLPRGMILTPATSGERVTLSWLPDYFAAQDSNIADSTNNGGASQTPGLWQFTVTASDGLAAFTRTIRVQVHNTNQTPQLLSMPLQLVSEGQTLSFTLRAVDFDSATGSNALRYALLHDASTPAGVAFDPLTGYFEWTPTQDVVANAIESDKAFTLTFQASDGQSSSTQQVQVRVFDVNHTPQLRVHNHAVVVGDSLSLPIALGQAETLASNAIVASDSDLDQSAAQQQLSMRFHNLPEGAVYDAVAQRLRWEPSAGQIGDTVISAEVSDGRSTHYETFTVRVVATAANNAPAIVISTTPSLPVLPGQRVTASVRADAWSGIANVRAEVRDSVTGEWHSVSLDAAGRIAFTPTVPGLVALRVTATDNDGFVATETQTIRVKDPADSSAPQLHWAGLLASSTNSTMPLTISELSALQVQLQEQQLMGWRLEIASGTDASTNDNGSAWQTLAQQNYSADAQQQTVTLASLNPADWANGVYQLRLNAWDLAGRQNEISANIIIDSTNKRSDSAIVSDGNVTLAGHTLSLTRFLAANAATVNPADNHWIPAFAGMTEAGPTVIPATSTVIPVTSTVIPVTSTVIPATSTVISATSTVIPVTSTVIPAQAGIQSGISDFGNWQIPLLSSALTHDQSLTDDSGITAAWRDGARVWLSVPAVISGNSTASAMTQLSFTLHTRPENLTAANTAGSSTANNTAPQVWFAQFVNNDSENNDSGNNANDSNSDWTLTPVFSTVIPAISTVISATSTVIPVTSTVIPAQAGIQSTPSDFADNHWIPASAGMTGAASAGMTGAASAGMTEGTTPPLTRIGSRLYDQSTGLPWQPEGFVLTHRAGTAFETQYQLDAQGHIERITFADGAQWLVSDAGIVAVKRNDTASANAGAEERIDVIRNTQGRIERLQISSLDNNGNDNTHTLVYRYNSAGQLMLARDLAQSGQGHVYAYDNNGQLITSTITKNLGSAVQWRADSSTANNNAAAQWSGSLTADTTLAFIVRDSELVSTVHTAGAAGAIIYRAQITLTAGSDLSAITFNSTGVQELGRSISTDNTNRTVLTVLLRATDSGVKVLQLSGTGDITVRLDVAGDLNHDGLVDGNDSALLANTNALDGDANRDVNGDGSANATDRQILYANLGFRANEAPQTIDTNGSETGDASLRTHADLAGSLTLDTLAQDNEGDNIFWRVLSATHGRAQLSADGHTLLFTPEPGYTGTGQIRLQADDGFSSGEPVVVSVAISGAKLIALHLNTLPTLQTGQSARVQATADFADESGVVISNTQWLTITAQDLAPLGLVQNNMQHNALRIDDNRDTVQAVSAGPALIIATRIDSDGRSVRAVQALNITPATTQATLPVVQGEESELGEEGDDSDIAPAAESETLTLIPDVYPDSLSLLAGMSRQLKVHIVDPGTGELRDVHNARQTLFAGTAETTETLTDPMIGVESGEALLDDNGQPVVITTPARPAIYSGTRYIVSDETVATISADGLISALQNGEVTLSIVHLASVVDGYGNLSEQIIGQTDIHLSVTAAQSIDNDDSTAPPSAVEITAANGGIVQAATGETVLIGAGALAADTAVSITRVALTDLENAAGMALPSVGTLTAIGAFRLDLGARDSVLPVQLRIPVQLNTRPDGTPLQEGDEVVFCRRGSFVDGNVVNGSGSTQDVWWLLDNGFISLDSDGNAIARTASPPFAGAGSSGLYGMFFRPGNKRGQVLVQDNPGNFTHFIDSKLAVMGSQLANSVLGVMDLTGIVNDAGSIFYQPYTVQFGVPTTTTAPQVIEPGVINQPSSKLPPVTTPWGTVTLPNIERIEVDRAHDQLIVRINNPSATTPEGQKLSGSLQLRALFDDGSHRDIQTLSGTANGDTRINIPADSDFAIGRVRWQLVRQVSTDTLSAQGNVKKGDTLEFAGNSTQILPVPGLMTHITRNDVIFTRVPITSSTSSSTSTNSNSNEFIQRLEYHVSLPYLTGSKDQPMVFSPDNAMAFVAGNGVLYVIDTIRFKLIDTLSIPAGQNITALAVNGNTLFLTEGSNNGISQGRIAMLDYRALGSQRGDPPVISFKTDTPITAPYGYSSLTLGPDGRTLVVLAPQTRSSITPVGPEAAKGQVLVFDLATFNIGTGLISDPVIAQYSGNDMAYNSGKGPSHVSATKNADEYLVCTPNDYDRGLATLNITRNQKGQPQSAQLSAIHMPGSPIPQSEYGARHTRPVDRLDIQRASSAVLVSVDGIDYAIVADDNMPFNDPYYRDMFAVPTFMQLSPFGSPTAVGGAAGAKVVNVGGKLGVIKDPFGKEGTPEYLGATKPLDGYGIRNLGLLDVNGARVLVGNLYGYYSLTDPLHQQPHNAYAWDFKEVIRSVQQQNANDPSGLHGAILPASAERLIAGSIVQDDGTRAGTPIAALVGTAIDDVNTLELAGNMGDIITVDLRIMAARQLAAEQVGPKPENEKPTDYLKRLDAYLQAHAEIGQQLNGATFTLKGSSQELIYDPLHPNNNQLVLLTNKDVTQFMGTISPDLILSRIRNILMPDSKNQYLNEGKFNETGVFFLRPKITQADLNRLRRGERLADKAQDIAYVWTDANGVSHTNTIKVKAQDFEETQGRIFFGDRPLENPGYSAFALNGEVSIARQTANTIDRLDVYKVEQRLKYFGFCLFRNSGFSGVTGQPRTPKELNVDGKLEEKEIPSIRAFYSILKYNWNSGSGSNGIRSSLGGNSDAAKHILPNSATLAWLNAYNAPHWVSAYSFLGISGLHMSNGFFKDNTSARMEVYSTSWLADLLKAQQISRAQQGLENKLVLLNGLTDPTRVGTGEHTNGGHSVGMGVDWGFGATYIVPDYQGADSNLVNPYHSLPQANAGWSADNALVLASGAYLPSLRAQNGGAKNDQAGALRNFLTLYMVTQQDDILNNGTWEDLPIQNGSDDIFDFDKVRKALFGSGIQDAQQLGQHVWIGGDKSTTIHMNHYEALRKVLTHLGLGGNGMSNGKTITHYNHFHFDIRPPERVDLPQNLLAENKKEKIRQISSEYSYDNNTDISSMISDLYMNGVNQSEDLEMLTVDLPDASISSPVIMVAAKKQITTTALNQPKVLGVCRSVAYRGGEDGLLPISFDAQVGSYLVRYMGRQDLLGHLDDASAKVTILQQPQYGALRSNGGPDYAYIMTHGNRKADKIVALVEAHGETVKVILYLKPSSGGWDDPYDKTCKQDYWKISATDTTTTLPEGIAQSWINPDHSNITITFTDIPGQSLGTTTHTGDNTQITLDTDAAGYGWYIDPLLLDSRLRGNDESGLNGNDDLSALMQNWLPTSNPSEYQAKPGSAAEHKMDLLSTVFHELGHALGLSHSSSDHEVMAATLPPGVRRLPTGEELNAFADLLGVPHRGEDPLSPTPEAPLTFASLLVAALRRRFNPESNPLFASQTDASSAQFVQAAYDVAANPTLLNSDFIAANDGSPQGWNSTGSVQFNNGSASLAESPQTQTRLNQVFVLGEYDRFLSFTVQSQLQGNVSANEGTQNNSGPGDAFELALIDANTGLSLLGDDGLSHGDAVLNIQANGTEHKAAAISSVINADGSRTYLVDLAGIAAGTALNLSFDLIGFGAGASASNSRVQIRDLHLGVPQLSDDIIATREDTAISFDALANDINARQPGFVPVIVTAPEHGSVAITANGEFVYTPEANYNGSDSFRYQLSNGHVSSNIATVAIAITPVNDAPTAGDQTLATDEDTPLIGSLLAAAADIDSTGLTATVVAGPQHGRLSLAADGRFTYLADANYNGSDSFTYKVNDGELDSAIATVNLTINAVNDAPVAQDGSATLNEDGQVILDLRTLGVDIDSSALTALIVTGPTHGTLIQNADGSFTYLADANYNGSDVIRFKLHDEDLDSNEATVTLTVNAVNDAPTAGDQALATDEDTPLTGSLLATAADIDSTGLTATVVAGPQHGQLSLAADGSFTYLADANYNGSDSFSYKVNDGELDSAIATVNLTINAVNDVPVAQSITVTTDEDTPVAINISALVSDIDSSDLQLTIIEQPAHGILALVNGIATYTPSANYNGTDSFRYQVSDGELTAEGVISLLVNAVNDAPTLNPVMATLLEDGAVVLNLMSAAADVDGDALQLSVASAEHGSMIANGDGSWTYRPVTNYSGEETMAFSVSDGQLSAASFIRLTITAVADKPVLQLSERAGSERDLFTTTWESVINRNSTSTLVQQKELDGWTLVTRPDNRCGGSNGFEIWSTGDKMMDAGHTHRTVSATADGGNNWMELNNSGGFANQTLGIERSFQTVSGASYSFSLDLAGRLGYSSDYTRIGIYVDGVRIGGDDSVSPASALNWQQRSFTFAGNGLVQTLRIVSEATRVDANGRGMMLDNLHLTETLSPNTGYEDGFIPLSHIYSSLTDLDGSESLRLQIAGLPTGSTLSDGTNTFVASIDNNVADITGWNLSTLRLLPPANYHGTLTLRVIATATESSNGNSSQSEAELLVHVLPVNDAPVAHGTSYSVMGNLAQSSNSVRIDLRSLVSDVDNDALTISISCNPCYGSLMQNSDGSYSYTPRKGYYGADSLRYRVSDGHAASEATISLTVQNPYPPRDDHDDGHCQRLTFTAQPSAPTSPLFTIDWQARAELDISLPDRSNLLWRDEDEAKKQSTQKTKTLAELTGLVVKVQ